MSDDIDTPISEPHHHRIAAISEAKCSVCQNRIKAARLEATEKDLAALRENGVMGRDTAYRRRDIAEARLVATEAALYNSEQRLEATEAALKSVISWEESGESWEESGAGWDAYDSVLAKLRAALAALDKEETMTDDKMKADRGEASLRQAALGLSYQYIIDWAQGRIDEQTPPAGWTEG